MRALHSIANATPDRSDRDAVDIPASTPEERVPQPPSLRLQPAKGPTHRVLRPRPDAAASGQAHPATSVQHQRARHQRHSPADAVAPTLFAIAASAPTMTAAATRATARRRRRAC